MNENQHDAVVEEPETPPEGEGAEAGESVAPEELQRRLEAARDEAETAREQHLRAMAELENVRRRAARDVENAHKYGVERLAAEILAVRDTMEMGLQSASESGAEEAVVEGLKATLKLMDQCLAKFGITPVDPQEQSFDPEFHEAMAAQPSADHEAGTVLMVVQKGYRIHDRLLRPARVIVSRAAEE